MSAIRPDLPPVSGQPAPVPAPVRNAQAAFFRAALDQVQAPQAGAVRSAATASPSGPTSTPDPPRSPRPGSLLDIRV